MPASNLPTEDPKEPSQSVYPGHAGLPTSNIPTSIDPGHISTFLGDRTSISAMNGHANAFINASSDASQETMTTQTSNGTSHKEEHNGETMSELQISMVDLSIPARVETLLETDDEYNFLNNTQTWHVFTHKISVKTGFPNVKSWSHENGQNGKAKFDFPILEEEALQPSLDEDLVSPQVNTYDLAVVIPTRNEYDNIMPLLDELQEALVGIKSEIIFVDDSDDDTPLIIKNASSAINTSMFQVHLEHRQSSTERAGGLATAVVQGMNRAQAEYVAVIDADLQHPPKQLRVFYDQAVMQSADLVIASRYIKGGSYEGLAGIGRRLISVGLKWTAKFLFPGQLLRISDPLGGFFLLRRSLLGNVPLRPIGYKILLELLIRCQWQHAIEVPYHFRARANGKSKANIQQGIMAVRHMLRLWREVPNAGRIWKISILVLLNVLITIALFNQYKSFPNISTNINVIVFAVIACLDFFLFNRYIFPSPIATSNVIPIIASLPATEAGEKVELSASMNGNTNGYHPHLIEDKEKVELPSTERVDTPEIHQKRKLQLSSKKHFYDKLPSILAVAVMILAIGWISYAQPGAWLVLAVLLFGFAFVFAKNVNRDQAITMILAIAVVVSTIDYVSWRITATNWHGWWVSVPLLFAEVFGALHVLGFQFTVWPRPPVEIEDGEDPTQYPIFVFIPTVNEGAAILRPTLEGIITARAKYLAQYPHGQVTIVVCNDGQAAKAENWEETGMLAHELGVCCVTRTKGGGAKAGNIENARMELQATGDALLVIFDADQVAKPDFLLKTIPPFRDPKMGWVQTGQYYANLDNPVSYWADDQQSMFYNLLCPGKEAINSSFICGTNVVIRATALDEIGGLPQDSVTEDFKASIELHKSWKSIYLKDVLATGLGPLDIPSYLKQQGRWAIGTLGVFRTHWREIILPRRHGLRIGQRVQYFLACTHYLCGLRDLIYLVSPILFILTGIPAVRSSYLSEYLWHFLPYGILGAVALWYSARGITGFRGIIIGFGSFPVLIGSLLSVILRRKVGFAVTSKQHGKKRSLRYLRLYIIFLLFCVASLIWATQVKGQQATALFISILWVIYSIVMLSSFLWLSFKDIRFQTAIQQSGATDEIIIKHPYPSKLLRRRPGLHPVWNLGLAALIAIPILASNSLGFLSFLARGQSTPFVISQEKIAAPFFGVSLPIQLLKNWPIVLEHDLDTQFSIIGRTQDIHDFFDATWADQLAAEHARPWITLQFGVFGPHQKPPLDANLPAIYNGLHDQEIRRWAEAIRDYGKPIYLTILLHADKNWSLSSGVANGGIPEDVPKAWMYVQSIFRAVGANNVAWVWAPADPLHDQLYAPPTSTIDAVLQTIVNYPGTIWGDPETALLNLAKRYPMKPIFIDATANGLASQKAAWITKLGQAVMDIPQIYALLYHEGGPGLDPNSAQIESWSFTSDPESLAAMRSIVDDLHNKSLARSY